MAYNALFIYPCIFMTALWTIPPPGTMCDELGDILDLCVYERKIFEGYHGWNTVKDQRYCILWDKEKGYYEIVL